MQAHQLQFAVRQFETRKRKEEQSAINQSESANNRHTKRWGKGNRTKLPLFAWKGNVLAEEKKEIDLPKRSEA